MKIVMTYYFWGSPDTSIQFCEDKYVHSDIIAEYYNTITASLYVLVGLLLMWSSAHRLAPWVILVGVGSMMLHMTLRYYGQWLDEISMLVLSFQSLVTLRNTTPQWLIYPLLIMYGFLHSYFIYFFIVFTLLQFYLGYVCMGTVTQRKTIFIYLYILLLSLGTICWMLDQFLCSQLGYLQLHSWWHVLTAMGMGIGMLLINTE